MKIYNLQTLHRGMLKSSILAEDVIYCCEIRVFDHTGKVLISNSKRKKARNLEFGSEFLYSATVSTRDKRKTSQLFLV